MSVAFEEYRIDEVSIFVGASEDAALLPTFSLIFKGESS